MLQRKSLGIMARQWAMACMLFVGAFGFASQVLAAEGRVNQIRNAVSKRDIAEAVRLVPVIPTNLALRPLAEKLRAMQTEVGIMDGQSPYSRVVFGDLESHGFAHHMPLVVSNVDGKVYSTGDVNIMANPSRTSMSVMLTIDRGLVEYVLDQTLFLKNGELASSGTVTKADMSNPDIPNLLAVGSGLWSYQVSPAQEVIATNEMIGNTAMADSADTLADEATDGFGDCKVSMDTTDGSGGVACAITIGIVAIVIIAFIILCYLLCWLLVDGNPANFIFNRFFNLKERLQRALEGGGQPCRVYA